MSDPARSVTRMSSEPLTDLERRVLDFAGKRWQHDGNRDQAIRDAFGISSTRYFQILHGLLLRHEALAYAPVTVRRHQRLVEQRRRNRTGAHPG